MSDSNHKAPLVGETGAVSDTVIPPPLPSSLYVEPLLVNSHLSDVSFHLIATFVEVPRSISMPAFSVGEPVTLLFRITMLSSTVNVSVFIDVVVPETVKLPVTTRLSSTVTVPPAESIVKSPDVVSISLAAVTPTLIASAVTPAKVTLSVVPTA